MVKRLTIMLISGLMLGSAQAAMVWQPVPEPNDGAHGEHGKRGAGTPFRLLEGNGAEVVLWAPNLDGTPVKLSGEIAKISSRGVNNYHALVAVREQAGLTEAAIRYPYMHGKPSGESPEKVVSANKLTLEIMPDPLPREHWRYQSNDVARFVIKWQGVPVKNSEVLLTTANGANETVFSDADGVVEFILPDDFTEVTPGRQGNKPAEFVLSASHQQGERQYLTTFSAAYHVDPFHWQSNQLALLMVGVGFIAGLGVVRMGRKEVKA